MKRFLLPASALLAIALGACQSQQAGAPVARQSELAGTQSRITYETPAEGTSAPFALQGNPATPYTRAPGETGFQAR